MLTKIKVLITSADQNKSPDHMCWPKKKSWSFSRVVSKVELVWSQSSSLSSAWINLWCCQPCQSNFSDDKILNQFCVQGRNSFSIATTIQFHENFFSPLCYLLNIWNIVWILSTVTLILLTICIKIRRYSLHTVNHFLKNVHISMLLAMIHSQVFYPCFCLKIVCMN